VTPYFWFADIGASLRHEGAGGVREMDVEVGADDYFNKLEMAFPLALEARRGRWSILSDVLYMRVGTENSRVNSVEFNSGNRVEIGASTNLGTNSTLEIGGWTLLSGYRWRESEKGFFEPTFGLRYLSVQAKTDWMLTGAVSGPGPGQTFEQAGSVKESEEYWDILVGCRGQARIGKGRFSVPYAIDLGTGESDFTWQAMAGLAYAFNWGDISATYRHLEYHVSGASLVDDLRFSGPSLGVSFKF
jgi:hypothetical protein